MENTKITKNLQAMKIITKSEFDSIKITKDYEKVLSFNNESTFNKNTKILIIGTLTPPNTIYFYASKQNSIYSVIDTALGTDLTNHKNDKSNKEIKEILTKNNIAFIDVVKEAIRKKNSSKDSDITYCTLDYESFNELKNIKTTIITNSRYASSYFDKIKETLNLNNNYIYLSQSRFHIDKNEWVKIIKEAAFK